MKRLIKVLMPVAVTAVAGLLLSAESADALSCTKFTTTWTTQGLCSAPNQNRGSLQGGGSINTNGRNLFLQVTNGFGNTGGTGTGWVPNGAGHTQASGPNGICSVSTTPGVPKFSSSGRCNNGTRHQLTVNFN